MATPQSQERRILVIDDEPAICKTIQRVLTARQSSSPKLDSLEASLFGPSTASAPAPVDFVVESASQGEQGLALLRKMKRLGQPFAMAFVDMRMPPGWDGLETIERLWAEDPELEVVICSAFSDYSWDEVIRRLKRPDLRLLSKPFTSKDVLELAWSLTTRWRRRQPPTS